MIGTVTATLAREHPLPTEGERQILRPDQLARFLASIDRLVINPDHGECWIWTKEVDNNKGGYARFYLGKKETEDGRIVSVRRAAHVISYMHHVGPIPADWIVDHMCNNKACVRPEHLETIPNLENLQRAQKRRPWKRHNQYAPDYSDRGDWRYQL